MPPKRKTSKPRAYGRQAEGRTIKSISLNADLARWAETQAEAEQTTFSSWLEAQIAQQRSIIEEPSIQYKGGDKKKK